MQRVTVKQPGGKSFNLVRKKRSNLNLEKRVTSGNFDKMNKMGL